MSKIKITFPDGNTREFEEGITGFQIAESISPRLAQDALAVEVNGIVKDINVPLKNNSVVKFLSFDDTKGKEVYWHSTSHLMAHAILSLYPEAKFGVGPPIENGFYYDFDIDKKLSEDDLKVIEERMSKIAKEE